MSSNGNKNNQPRYQQQTYYNSNTNSGHTQSGQQNQTANPNGYQIHHVQQIPMSVMAAAAAAANTQNLKGSPQSSDYHVQQCLVQGPPPHSQQHPLHTSHPPFRILHQRDGYQVATPNTGYPNQSGPPQSQIRGLPPNAPPTPPQTDMKISGGQQQMVHNYVPGRNANQNMYRPSQNQPPRNMSRQQMMATQPFMPMAPIHPMPYPSPQYTLTQRQAPQPQIYSPNQFNIMTPYNCYFNPVQAIPHTRPMSAPNLTSNTQPQIGLPPNVLPTNTQPSNQPRKRRPNALKVEDPTSGKDVLEEVLGEEPSHSVVAPVQHTVAISEVADFESQQEMNNIQDNIIYNIDSQLPPPVVVQQQQSMPIIQSRAIPIQDALSETPVVSAQQDGPSIEIIPKSTQPIKKIRKLVASGESTATTTTSAAAPSAYSHVSRNPLTNGIDKCITASIAIYNETMASTSEKVLYTSPAVLQQIKEDREKVKSASTPVRPIVTPSPPLEMPHTPSPPITTTTIKSTTTVTAPVQSMPRSSAVVVKTKKHNKSVTASLAIYKDTIENPKPHEVIMYPTQEIVDVLDKEKLSKELVQEEAVAGIDKCITASTAVYNESMASTTEKVLHTSPHIVQQIKTEKEQLKSASTPIVARPIITPSPPLDLPPTPSPIITTTIKSSTTMTPPIQSVPRSSATVKPKKHNKSVTASLAIYKDTVENPKPNEAIMYPRPDIVDVLNKERLAKELREDVVLDWIKKSEEFVTPPSIINTEDNKILEKSESDFINNNLTTVEIIAEQIVPDSDNTQNMTTIEAQSSIEQMNNLNNNIGKDIPDVDNNIISTYIESDIIAANDVTVPVVVSQPTTTTAHVAPSAESVTISIDSGIGVSAVPSTVSILEEEKIIVPIKKDLIEYEEGQWSPNNQDGKKVYSIDQLRKLKDSSVCLTKPDVKEHEVVLREVRSANSRSDPSGGFQYNKFMGSGAGANTGNTDNIFLPNFARTNSNRGGGGRDYGSGKRISQTGNKQQGGSKSGSKTGMIHVTLSLRDVVKLNETENAWKPSMLADNTLHLTLEERFEQELFKQVRGILNKLTPEKFATLIQQMKQLTIDTKSKLSGVIELIFEKAVDEPNFSIAYAQMCSNLSSISINTGSQNQVIFQKLLLHHCQMQFEDIGSDKHTEFRKKMSECKDSEKLLEYEEEERKMRRRSVGTIRFVGELFKFEMLTVNIMLKCLNQMLSRKNEESLECLCKLLTTIGKNLTGMIETDEKVADKQQLQKIFDEMEGLTTNKQFKISSRVRFMLQDVIDLKRSNWNPRRQDLNPKKMGEILKEAENEQLNIQLMNYQPTRKEEGRRPIAPSGGSSSMSYLAGRGSVSEDGWSTQTSKNSRSSISNIDPKKLQTSKLNITNNMALGSASYYKWNTRQQTPLETPTTNKFSPLLVDSQKTKRPFTSGTSSTGRNKDSYHSRDSMERYDRSQQSRIDSVTYSRNSQSHDPYDSPIMRAPPTNKLSSSSMMAQSNEATQQIRAPSPLDDGAQAFIPTSRSQGDLDQMNLPEPTEAIIKRILNSFDIFEEYCNNITTMDDCEIEMERIPSEYRWSIPRETYCHVLEHKRKHRIKISEFFVYAIKKYQSIKLNHFIYGLQKYLDLTEDFSIDYPKIWEYVAEMLGPLLRHKIINLKDLVIVATGPITANLGAPLLANLFEELLGEYGPKFIRNLWKSSEVQWTDFIKTDIKEYVNSNNLYYVTDLTVTPPNPKRKIDMTEFQEKLLSLLTIQTPYDELIEWISVTVENHDNNNFIRTLTTSVLKFSLEKTSTSYKLNLAIFESQIQLLRRYIENNENNELQCLYAIQRLINNYEHPAGVLRQIVEKLYEEDIISLEGFTNWKHSTDPNEQEGKGVAQSSLVSFFTSLNEQVSSDDNIDESDNKDSKN